MPSLPSILGHIRFTRRSSLLLFLGVFFALGLILLSTFLQSKSETPPLPTATSNLLPTQTPNALQRLARPTVIPNAPHQLNRGAEIYWGVCMACHGDRGQGLTDEWRSAYGEDSNCWASGCHGKDHPTPGFEIPKTLIIPPVAGPGTLARFSNAYELYQYLLETMPWWNPGSLTSEDAWALTAYLLRMNKVWPENLIINSRNAAAVPIHRLVGRYQNDTAPALILAGLFILAAILMVGQTILENSNRQYSHHQHRPNFFLHLHPPTIPAAQARLRYTLGAGGLSIFLSLILLITGALEMIYYSPTPEKAAISVSTITYFVPFGRIIRGLHFWSAQLLLITATIHWLRVILTGAYSPPRQWNYLIGLGMLTLILFLDFTGYILRWDEGIHWALVVGTNLLKTIPWIGEQLHLLIVGASEPGAGTLIRFYAWHVFLLTFGMIALGIWHIFRIRRDGGIATPPPKAAGVQQRIHRQILFSREMIAMLATGAILLMIVTLFPAPLAAPLTQTFLVTNEGRAPWFFLWVQQLLKLGNPFLFGVLIPILILGILIALPFIPPLPTPDDIGHWFPASNRHVQILILFMISIILFLTFLSTIS